MSTGADIEYSDDVCDAADRIVGDTCDRLAAAGLAPRDVPHALVAGACAILHNNMCRHHYRAELLELISCINLLLDELPTEDDRPCGHVH